MSNRCVVLCVLLSGVCFISWKHSIIGVNDALKLAGRGFIFLGICTWLISIFPRLKFFFFPVTQELTDSPTPESSRLKEEQVRRTQQDLQNDKMSDYAENVLKPRQNSLLQQKTERYYRMTGETWKLSPGLPVGGDEDKICHAVDVDESPNQGARRRRKPMQTVTQDPVQEEVPKQKRVIVLPDEPSVDTEGAVKIALRFPGRRAIHRRFLKTWSSQLLLEWMMKTGYPPALYTLYMSYPRTEVQTAADMSLEEAGIHTDTLLNVEEKEPLHD